MEDISVITCRDIDYKKDSCKKNGSEEADLHVDCEPDLTSTLSTLAVGGPGPALYNQ